MDAVSKQGSAIVHLPVVHQVLKVGQKIVCELVALRCLRMEAATDQCVQRGWRVGAQLAESWRVAVGQGFADLVISRAVEGALAT